MSDSVQEPSPQTTNPTASAAAPAVSDAAASATPAPATTNAPVAEAVPASVSTFLGEVAPEVKTQEAAPAAEVKQETPAPEVKPEEKAADVKPVEEPKKEEVAQSEPAQAPTYEPFTFPEGVKPDEARLGEFTKDLGEFQNSTKADQKIVQEFGQKIVDKYVAQVQEDTKRVTEYFTNAWEKQKSDWKTALEADPEIGGNRIQTTKASINKALMNAPEAHKKEFTEYMNSSGIGNNPAIIRMFTYLSNKLNAYESETAKPLPGTKPVAASVKTHEKFYGKKS